MERGVRGDSYYRWFPGDYMRDTAALSMLEDGAYRRLLDAYYSEGWLPSDRERLCLIARAVSPDQKAAVDFVTERFFRVDGDRLYQNRAERELAERKSYIEKQTHKSKLGVEARWGTEGKTRDTRGHTRGHTHGHTHGSAPASASESATPEKTKSVRAKKPSHAFTPPTVEEVRSYCAERGNTIDPQHFVDSNEAKGWVIGKNRTPAKDWKAMIRTWERNDNAGPGTVINDGELGPGGNDRGNGEDIPVVLSATTVEALEEVTPPDKRKFVASILGRNLSAAALARDGFIPLALAERLINTLRPELVQ